MQLKRLIGCTGWEMTWNKQSYYCCSCDTQGLTACARVPYQRTWPHWCLAARSHSAVCFVRSFQPASGCPLRCIPTQPRCTQTPGGRFYSLVPPATRNIKRGSSVSTLLMQSERRRAWLHVNIFHTEFYKLIVSGQSGPLHPAAFFSCCVTASFQTPGSLQDFCLVTRQRSGSITAPSGGQYGGALIRKVPR